MAQPNPQGTGRWYFDLNRRANPFIDNVDFVFLVILLFVALALVGYGAITGAPYWTGGVLWVDRHILLVVPLPPKWVFQIVSIGLLIAMMVGPFRAPPYRPGPTTPRNASQEDSDAYRSTATLTWRSYVAASTPPDWLIAGALLCTAAMVICSNYDDGMWTMLGMKLHVPPYASDTREIFDTTSAIFGWILGIIGATVTGAICMGGLEGWWSDAAHRAAHKRRVATGAAVGAAIGAYQELRKPVEERRTAAGTISGAVVGGVVTHEVEAVIPALFAFALAAGVGYLCYLVGYYAIGAPIGAIVFMAVMAWKAVVALWMLFVALMLSLFALMMLRGLWRVPIEATRRLIGFHRPFPRSRTRWTGAEDWVLVEKTASGSWTSVWQT